METKMKAKAVAVLAVCAVAAMGLVVAQPAPDQAQATPRPAKAKVQSASSPSAGKLAVKVKKSKGARKYVYQVAFDKKFKSGRKELKTKKRSATFSGLSQGKRYFVRVRAVAGKAKGKWSAVKSATVKKAAAPGGKKGTPAKAGSGNASGGKAAGGGSYTASYPAQKLALSSGGYTRTVKSPVTGYSYSFRLLNEGPLYTDTPVLVHVRTDNPKNNNAAFGFAGGGVKSGGAAFGFADVKYTEKVNDVCYSGEAIQGCARVTGGYLVNMAFPTTGERTVKLYEGGYDRYMHKTHQDTGIELSVDVAKDRAVEKRRWMQSIVDRYAAGKTTTYDKLAAVSVNINRLYYYMHNAYAATSGEYEYQVRTARSAMYEEWNPYGWTSWNTCYGMCFVMEDFALFLGVPESDISIEPAPGNTNGTGHWIARIKCDGKTLSCTLLAGSKVSANGTTGFELDCRTFDKDRLL